LAHNHTLAHAQVPSPVPLPSTFIDARSKAVFYAGLGVST
jgi:hypothetical protein